MIVFEEFDHRLKPVIEFDLNLFPLAAKIHENDVQLIPPMLECRGQFGIPNSGPHAASFSEPDIPISGQPVVNDEESDSDVDNDYDVNEDADSDVSLDVDCGKVDDDRHDRCDLNGDDTWLLQSSDEETEVIKMAKYCRQHQWAPNPDGSIEISEGQILGNAKVARDVLKRYAIQEVFAMNKIKNDKCRYTVSCKNKTCDWRVHVSSLPDGVTFMVRNVAGGHILCPMMTSNKKANARWVASVLQSTIHADPKLTAKSLKMTLLENYSVTCSSLTIYRAKKIVLNNMKSGHIAAYTKMKKYGNAIIAMNPGTCVKVSLTKVPGTNPRERIKSLGEDSMEAVSCLMKEPCEKWARHAFDCDIKLDHITNNMSEYFNNWIKDERDKPILTLLEHLRKKVMVRFSDKCDELEKLQDSITPYARQTLTRNEKKGRKLQVYHGMGDWYETINKKGRKMLVNIGEVTCDCGMWQISGLPCKHDVTVFMYNREFPHDHVHWYYTKEAVKLTYNGAINPIPDESRWHEYHSEHIDPPAKRTKVGRPKKIRKRAPDKSRAPSKTFSNRCQTCKNIGHNSRICKDKGKGVGSSSKEKKTSKRSVVAPTFGTQEANQTGNGGSTDTTFQQSMAPLTSASQQYSTAISARNQEGISTESEQHMAAPTNVPDGCSQIGSLSQP
ncbi:hypothetical protein LWI28_017278 [Acer negundo]|uniref:SWIM-type domain-containing protein n=1 Tax=Acer negundo TaxID=4023 RepID=A0AAD5J5E6_ACENE|nr:hypothetical protein LWI28_017278 [Acer negundo]